MKRIIALLTAVLLLFSLTACAAEAPTGESTGTFRMEILSTGKSDCIILCMDDLVIVNDAADEDDFETICAALEEIGAEKIDYLILSHYDKDHIGSAAELVRTYEVGEICGPAYEENSVYLASLERAAESRSVPFTRLEEDKIISAENGSVLIDPPDIDYGDDNNNSLITTVTWKGENLLLLGDAKKDRLKEQLEVSLESYRFIKLPHHGDSNKPLLKLIDETKPTWAAVTAESETDIEPKLKTALTAAQTTLFCTANGPLTIHWTGTELTAEQNAS